MSNKTKIEDITAELTRRGWKVAVAETTGVLSLSCVSLPWSSSWFLEGRLAYSHEAKTRLGCRPEVMIAHGTVSTEGVREMARAIRETTGADIGLAESSIVGPGGGTPDKPVGTYFVSLVSADVVLSLNGRVIGTREQVQQKVAEAAWGLLRIYLNQDGG